MKKGKKHILFPLIYWCVFIFYSNSYSLKWYYLLSNIYCLLSTFYLPLSTVYPLPCTNLTWFKYHEPSTIYHLSYFRKHKRKRSVKSTPKRTPSFRDFFCLKAYYKEMKMQKNISDSIHVKGQSLFLFNFWLLINAYWINVFFIRGSMQENKVYTTGHYHLLSIVYCLPYIFPSLPYTILCLPSTVYLLPSTVYLLPSIIYCRKHKWKRIVKSTPKEHHHVKMCFALEWKCKSLHFKLLDQKAIYVNKEYQ